MRRWSVLLPIGLTLASTAALADPPAPAGGPRPFVVAFSLFPLTAARGPVATDAPMNLLPVNLPPPRRVAPPPVALADMPLPRPKPTLAPVTEAAEAAAIPAEVDPRTTGATAAPPPPPAATAAAPEPDPQPRPPVAIAVAAPSASAAGEAARAEAAPPPAALALPEPPADGIASDPGSFDIAAPDVGPRPLAPSAIRLPRQAALPAPADAVRPPVPVGAPHELVRSLQLLQDRMARGDLAALAAQHALRAEIDRTFARADASVWVERRNAEAAITYVLSGGTPEILQKLTALDPKPAVDERLLAGVLAYTTGDAATAGPLLDQVDLAAVPAGMAGLVAIARSALAVKTDPDKAMKLLGLARLLSTGTLVEEAALRRQLFVADQRQDEAAVKSLARQYLDRFRHSVYAGNFRARLAAAISHMRSIDREDRFAELDDILAMVEPDARCQLYLTVAVASAINRRMTSARLAAERASGLALAGSVEEARARLYHAAALVGSPGEADRAAEDLKGLKSDLLAPADRALLAVVEATVAGVRSGTDLGRITVAVAEPLGAGARVEESPILKRAEAALAETRPLVENAR